jgi:hypothetical protein
VAKLDILKLIESYPEPNAAPEIKACIRGLLESVRRAMEVEYVEPLHRTDFTVQGDGPFPIDMLRYTCSWPATEADARAIEESHEHADYTDPFTVRLSKYHRDPKPELSDQRWRSKFRCTIVGVVETVEL